MQMTAEMMELRGVFAPLLQLSADLVREPEAGMPPKSPHPMLAIPILNIS